MGRKAAFLKKVEQVLGDSLVSEIDESLTSQSTINLKCPKCKKIHQSCFAKIRIRTKNHPHLSTECKRCSHAIARERTRKTVERKYGQHYMRLPAFKAKMARTNLAKYGGIAPVCSSAVAFKIKSTNLERYGSANAQAAPEVREKVRVTSLERYGVPHHTKSPQALKKRAETCRKRYGVNNPAKVRSFVVEALRKKGEAIKEEVLPKIIKDLRENPNQIISSKAFQERHNVYYVTVFRWLREAGLDNLIPKGHQASSLEDEFFAWLSTECRETIIRNARGILPRLELDLWLPDANLAIEMNGLFWHSEYKKPKTYHLDKRVLCENKGITLLQINHDEWKFKSSIVKSMVRAKLGLVQTKLNARALEVRTVSKPQAQAFLTECHLMGPSYGTSNLGLYDGETLVSLMTYKKTEEGVELVRFCNALDLVVRGGFSKLLRRLPQTDIISFVDLRYATGHSLKRTGFELRGITLGWKWTDGQTTYNRRFCRANMDPRGLSEKAHAKELKLLKIYDAGQAKWVLKGTPNGT